MVMFTAKLSKRKLLLAAAVLLVVIVALCLCLRSGSDPSDPAAPETVRIDAATNEGRIAFLADFGWLVSDQPVQTQEVRVPEDENEVFRRYNDLQLSQGYDLTQYTGKTLHRYVYSIENYPNGEGAYYATVLVYKHDVVGGDVCSAAQNGVMHSFEMPAA